MRFNELPQLGFVCNTISLRQRLVIPFAFGALNHTKNNTSVKKFTAFKETQLLDCNIDVKVFAENIIISLGGIKNS